MRLRGRSESLAGPFFCAKHTVGDTSPPTPEAPVQLRCLHCIYAPDTIISSSEHNIVLLALLLTSCVRGHNEIYSEFVIISLISSVYDILLFKFILFLITFALFSSMWVSFCAPHHCTLWTDSLIT